MTDAAADWLRLVLAVLATWRVAHLLTAEDGPFGAVAALRSRLGLSFAGGMMDCFGCMSLWVALPFAFYVAERPPDLLMAWLGLSGAAFLLERAGSPPLMIRPLPDLEHGEPSDELLRPPAVRRHPDATSGDFGSGAEH
jgi:hypothetical protein